MGNWASRAQKHVYGAPFNGIGLVSRSCRFLLKPNITPSHTRPLPKQGPKKLRITLNSAVCGPCMWSVWLGVVLGSIPYTSALAAFRYPYSGGRCMYYNAGAILRVNGDPRTISMWRPPTPILTLEFGLTTFSRLQDSLWLGDLLKESIPGSPQRYG